MTVDVYTDPVQEYLIDGSFAGRNCTIFNSEKEVVAEIRRKVDVSTNVVLGKDVFVLWLRPRFDAAFAMGVVLALDQIHGADAAAENPNPTRVAVEPAGLGVSNVSS